MCIRDRLEDQLTRERETVGNLWKQLSEAQSISRNLTHQLMPPTPEQPTESPSVAPAVVGPARPLKGLLSRLWGR